MDIVEFKKEEKDKILSDIKDYFYNERDEDIGDVQAILLLDFFMELIGKAAYNQGVEDTKRFLEEKLDDLFSIYK